MTPAATPPAGRPRFLTVAKRAELLALVASGLDPAEAARTLGCSLRTVRRAAARDPEFDGQLTEAQITSRVDPVDRLRRAAQSDWRAAAWLLERTNPRQFARRGEGCCAADLQTVLDRVIETSLAEIDDHAARTRVYRAATAVARRALESLFPQRRRGPQLDRGVTPLRDGEAFNQWLAELNLASPPPPAGAPPKWAAGQGQSATHAAKTPAPCDKTPAPADKSPAHAQAPAAQVSPQNAVATTPRPPHSGASSGAHHGAP